MINMEDIESQVAYLRGVSLATNDSSHTFHCSDNYVDFLYNSSPPLLVMSERSQTISKAASSKLQRRQTRNDGETNVPHPTQNKDGRENTAKDQETKVSPTQFTKETICIPPSGISGLSKLLQGSGKLLEANGLNLLVYLPNQQPLSIQVNKSATVEQTIEKVLKLHKESKDKTLILPGSAACYELRLHEEDGLPEEDFPALERTREVKHFGGDGDHEYCLCQIEGVELADGGGDDINNSGKQQQKGTSEVQLPSGKYLKIKLPGNLHSTIKKNDTRYHTLRDLIPYLAKKQSMPNLYYETVQFEVSEEDCIKLNMMSTILDLGTRLVDLKVDNVELTTKTYADTPTKNDTGDIMGSTRHGRTKLNDDERNDGSSVLGRVAAQDTMQPRNALSQRPPETAFRFDALTAAIYQEWKNKKKNKWGRWQTRILGIDIKRMYNKMQRGGRERRGSTIGVKNPERLIADILEIEYVEGTTRRFRVKHVDGDTTQTVEYEAETSHDCVEIISKLKFILAH